MNDTLKRRLIGLAVLLVLAFALSLLLPHSWPESGEQGVPSATVPLAVNPGANDGTNPPQAAASETPAGQPSAASPAPVAGNASEPTPVSAIDSSAPPLPPAPAPKPAAAPPPAMPKPEVSQAKPAPPKPVTPPPAPPVTHKPSLAQAKPAPVAAPPPAPAPKPAPAPSIAPKMVTSIQAPPPAAAASSAAGRTWFVQIGSFADQGNAQTTLNLLQNIGYRGESQPINNAAGKTLYRVRLGPFPSEGAGQQALAKVTHQGYPQARLLSEESGKH